MESKKRRTTDCCRAVSGMRVRLPRDSLFLSNVRRPGVAGLAFRKGVIYCLTAFFTTAALIIHGGITEGTQSALHLESPAWHRCLAS